KPFDKAGSYGIQDEGFDFAIKLQGNLDCVIGFPVTLFKNLLTKM
ncbi:Maf family protein, partial [bacterium]|nr:Maf family protein [bacterium]